MSPVTMLPEQPDRPPFADELAHVMSLALDGECICSEPDRARSAFQCPVHTEEHPL